jgi:hypothetical protein
MIECIFMNMELWSGFFGTIIGAGIGGYIAYLIARFQFHKQEKQFRANEEKAKEEKEIQLLWQIYFDIKKDCENSKLWDKYDELLQKRDNIFGSPTAEYIHETLQYIMRDIRNFLKLLHGKESGITAEKYNELELLWERASQLLRFMFKIYKKLLQFGKISTSEIDSYYNESNDLILKHNELSKKSREIKT